MYTYMCVCTYKNIHTKHVLLSSFTHNNNFLQKVDLKFPEDDQ